MKLAGSLEQRLGLALQPASYRIVPPLDPVVIEEKAGEGRATVRIGGDEARIEWRIEGKGAFGFLKDTKNADGAFFVLRGGDAVEAHVVECKRTVTRDSWSKAKLQMRWTLLRLRALAGVLGLSITGVTCYTAYCDDEIEPDSSSSPSAGRIMTGDEDDPSPEVAEDVDARRRLFDWHGEQVHLRDFEPAIRHRKLPLELVEGVGVGSFSLAPG